MTKIKSNKKSPAGNALSAAKRQEVLGLLKERFEKNMNRHKGVEWAKVKTKLEASPQKLWSLHVMEETGGEPDVVVMKNAGGNKAGEYIFCDCSAESPKGRRSLCYDGAALASRKEHKPADSAMEMATAIGIEILSEAQYRELLQYGRFDTKTSSWLNTPADIRKLGGAIFGDFRYGQVFIYHNGAESYYAARGFRGLLRI